MSAMLREAGLLKELAKAKERIRQLEQEINAHRDNEETFADELQSVSSVPACQSVAVVGEPVGWRWVDASGRHEGVCIFTGQPSGGARRRAYELGCTPEFVIAKPTHSIPAAELDALRKDADNWRNRHEVSK